MHNHLSHFLCTQLNVFCCCEGAKLSWNRRILTRLCFKLLGVFQFRRILPSLSPLSAGWLGHLTRFLKPRAHTCYTHTHTCKRRARGGCVTLGIGALSGEGSRSDRPVGNLQARPNRRGSRELRLWQRRSLLGAQRGFKGEQSEGVTRRESSELTFFLALAYRGKRRLLPLRAAESRWSTRQPVNFVLPLITVPEEGPTGKITAVR